MRRESWGRGGLLCMALLLCLGPGRAAAELPLLSLPSAGLHSWNLDVLVGTRQVGVGTFFEHQPFWGTGGLALEFKKDDRNGAFDFEAAYYQRLTDTLTASSCNTCEDIFAVVQPYNVAAQLGLHAHTATRTSNAVGVGPAAGLSVSLNTQDAPWGGSLEGFVGVQSALMVTPARGRLGVPLRVSAGLQGSFWVLHLMLVGRAGWDDLRRDLGERPVYDATLGVGFFSQG